MEVAVRVSMDPEVTVPMPTQVTVSSDVPFHWFTVLGVLIFPGDPAWAWTISMYNTTPAIPLTGVSGIGLVYPAPPVVSASEESIPLNRLAGLRTAVRRRVIFPFVLRAPCAVHGLRSHIAPLVCG